MGALQRRLDMLDVACSRCDRAGRLSVARLIEQHGPALPLPELRRIVAAECPRPDSPQVHEQCDVFFPV